MTTTHVAPRIEGMHHLTLPVDDLAIAEQFYCSLLGATLVRRVDREAFLRSRPERAAELDADNSPLHLSVRLGDAPALDLFLQKHRVRPRIAPHPHIALRVDRSHLDPFIRRLRDAGVLVDGPRRLGPPGHASAYFTDPFGNLLELVTLDYEGAVLEGPPDVAALQR